MRYRFLAFLTLVVLSLFLYHNRDDSNVSKNLNDVKADGLVSLTSAEVAIHDHELTVEKMLTYAMQDEYHARATYKLTFALFKNQKPFASILRTEEDNITLLTALFSKYNLDIPQDEANSLTLDSTDLKENLQNVLDHKTDNIKMYELFLQENIPNDVKAAFTTLKNGSKQQLHTFEHVMSKY